MGGWKGLVAIDFIGSKTKANDSDDMKKQGARLNFNW